MLRWPIQQTLHTSYSGPNCKGEVAAHNSELPGTRSRQVLTHHSRSFTIKNSDITQGLDHGSSIYFNRLFGNEYNDLLQAWCMLENLWQLEGVGGLCFGVTETNFMESSSVLPPPPQFLPSDGAMFFSQYNILSATAENQVPINTQETIEAPPAPFSASIWSFHLLKQSMCHNWTALWEESCPASKAVLIHLGPSGSQTHCLFFFKIGF